MEILFWSSVVLVFYIYVGYPLLARMLARLHGRPVRRGRILPTVTVLTAARNEVQCIEAAVRNKLAQDYPARLLDVVVISDGSDDGTDEVVRRMGPRVRLLRQEPRAGKTAALNRAVAEAQGEILVFADANSMYAPDTISQIVANFADPEVGYVTGRMVYVDENGSLVGDGCSAYMKYENWLRTAESRLASVVGVDGGVDAVRKRLYRPMRPDQLPDFVLPLAVAEQGHRVVYEPLALLHEPALNAHDDEYRMRVRVSLRALWGLWDMRHLMNPRRHGLLAVQLVSHKLLRYTAFLPLLAAWISSLLLMPAGVFYELAALGQTAVYTLAMVGWLRGGRARSTLLAFPYYFLLLNVAAAHALARFFGGHRQVVWTPRTG